jgi:hypothetical protein
MADFRATESRVMGFRATESRGMDGMVEFTGSEAATPFPEHLSTPPTAA